jgi:hypothetical protein
LGGDGAMCAAPGSAKKSLRLIVLSIESLNAEYEHTCDLCVRRVTEALSCLRSSLWRSVLPNSKEGVNVWQERFKSGFRADCRGGGATVRP